MDRYTEERINMITGMIMKITDIQEKDVDNLIKDTHVYRNIIRGEECTLYEDYSANLMDIVKELRKKNVESRICEITADKVSDLNQWMFSNNIEDARQLKENIYGSQTAEAEVTADILNKDVLNFKTYRKFSTSKSMILGGLRKRNAMQYRVVACKTVKGMHPSRSKSGRTRTTANRMRKGSAKSNRKSFGVE